MTLQTVPAVPQVPAGYAPVQADLTLWVTSPFTFLATMPVFRAERAAAQSLSGGSYNILAYDTVLEDPYSGWSSGSSEWTCPAGCAGWYDVTLSGFAGSQGGTGDQNVAALVLNGTLWSVGPGDWAPSSGDGGASGAVQVPLLPGDTVQVWAYATASVSTPTTAGQLPAVELAWVSS